MINNDVLRVRVGKRPEWWMNVVYDYEDNVLGGRDKPYPDDRTWQVQHLERYGFITDQIGEWAIFYNPNDYLTCLLHFGGVTCRQ